MVYFVQEKGNPRGFIKIGMSDSRSVEKRLTALQTGSPVLLSILAVIPEAESDFPYHQEFDDARHHGEWFFPISRLTNFIKSLPPYKIKRVLKSIADFSTKHKLCRCGGLKKSWQKSCIRCFDEANMMKANKILTNHTIVDG